MIKIVQEFIERYIDLLDTNPQEFFLRAWEENKMDRREVSYMCAILYEAGIPSDDINSWREAALLQILDTQISDWALADGGVSGMPVYEFIEVFLDNCVGFDENYILLCMKKNASRWNKWAHIYMLHDMTVIERK